MATHCTRIEIRNTLERPQVMRVWPPNGAGPRVQFLAAITSPDDLFVRRKLLGLVDFVAGEENHRFAVPFDVHLTPDDLLLVTDPGRQAVHFINLREHVYREVQALGQTARLEQPIGVTADDNGWIYVSDSALGNVFVFNAKGEFVRPLTRAGTLQRPADLAYSSKTGLLYVADVTAHEIKALRPDGSLVRTLGGRGSEPGKLNFPTHLWVEENGTLFVTSAMDSAISIFDATGQFVGAFGRAGDAPGCFARPKGVATDRSGQVYVADALFDNVQVFDRHGSFLFPVGEPGAGAGEFWLPAGVFRDSRNRLWVADQHNHRVVVFQCLEAGLP